MAPALLKRVLASVRGDGVCITGVPISERLSKKTEHSFNPLSRAKTDAQVQRRDAAWETVKRKIASGDYALEARPCRICDGTRFRLVAEVDRFGFNLPTAICHSCGLVQSNPAMAQTDLFDFYAHFYRDLYGHKRAVDPSTIAHKAEKSGKAVYELVRRRKILPRKSELVVEVGAGDGALVSYFDKKGHRAIGIDFDEDYMATGRGLGLDLRKGPLSAVAFETPPKLIYYNHVLEHISELNDEVAAISQKIADDGYVLIVVPGIKHLTYGSYKGDLIDYLQIAHVAHFTLTTLTALFARHGFELVWGNERVEAIFRKGQGGISAEYASTVYDMHRLERRVKARG